MRTSPEGNDGGSAAPEGAEALLARADTALQEEVLSLLVGPESQERREHLFAIGALPTASSECAAVQEWILTTFREYNECTDEQEETEERARRYQELANLLCLAGIAIPITFRDWKVDRVAEAEQRWGLREGGAALLEELLIEQYAPPAHVRQPARVHLHKGPGNGQLMHHLRTGSRHMEEVGVGDRLYFTIESVLLQYVRPERRGDPIVRQIIATLSQALQGALHERWFEPVSDENGIIQRWQPRGFLCDLNDIFPLLAHPQEWLPNIYKKMMKALYRASEEFEDDRVDMVPHAAQEYIVQLADCEVDYAQAQCQRMQALHSKVIAAMRKGDEQSLEPSIHEFWLITGHMLRDVSSLADLSAKILETLNTEKEVIRQRRMQDSPARKLVDLKQGVDKRVQRLHTLRARISQTSSSADTETLATDFAAIAEHPSLPDGGWTHALLADAVEKEIEECQEQSQGFKRQIQAARKREEEVRDHARQTASASEKLQEIFTDEFATEITEHEQYEDPEYRKKGVRIDLNRSGPVMHFRQFIPGRFTSTLSQVPSESCLLISASRADSHEPSTPLKGFTGLTINLEDAPGEFEEDVGLTLNLLAPGGVYLTDGHRQSFTRIDRFEEIMRAVKGRDDFRVTLVVDRATHVPRSVLVQRRHPERGYLSESDLAMPFNEEEVSFVPCDHMMRRRPDLFVERVIRRQIDAIAGGNAQAFKDCQQHIGDDRDRSLRRVATANLARYLDLVDPGLLELTRKRVCEVVGDSFAPGASYGEHLRCPLRVTPKKIEGQSFFGLSNILMEACGVGKDAPAEVRQKYESELFHALSARVCRAVHGERPSDVSLTDQEYAAWKQEACQHAGNAELREDPLLTTRDVREIIVRMGLDLRERVRQLIGVQEPVTVGRGLETFRQGYLHVAPRIADPITRTNAHSEFPIARLATNHEFGTVEMQALEGAKIRQVRENLQQIRLMTGSAPIQLILFQDCGTNLFLEREVRRIVGEECYGESVANISIRFEPERGIDHLVTHFQRQNEERLHELSKKGVIFIVGGSWFNPDDPYGQFFQQTYGKLIHSALATQGSPARGLFICFGHQNMMDLIGEAHRGQLPEVRSGPGALEFCPTPVHVRDAWHPLFRDCPSRFTLMNTHGRHVDGLDNIQGSGQRYVRPVALSELTGLPIMCDLYQGKAYSMQTHPEVDLVTERDRDRIMGEVDKQGEDIMKTYNVGTKRLRTMWAETDGHIQENAGEHILTNALLGLSADIPIHGRPWKGGRNKEELYRRGWGRRSR